MLERVVIRNFRSIRELEWRPQKLNILVGPNNSGKTNICYALRFLGSAVAARTLDQAAKDACGATNGVHRRLPPGGATELQLTARVREREVEWRIVLNHTPDPGEASNYRADHESVRLADSPQHPGLFVLEGPKSTFCPEHWSGDPEDVQVTVDEDVVPRECLILDVVAENLADPSVVNLTRFVQGFAYYRIDARDLRVYPELKGGPILSGDGANLAAVVCSMQREDPQTYAELVSLMQIIEPSLLGFHFAPTPEGTVVLGARMAGIEGLMSLHALSDGTLRYMALATVVLQHKMKTARQIARPTLVMFEEPENGLWVRHLGELVKRLDELSANVQTIITTHNPFLLDYFDDRPECIFVVSGGDEEMGTTIKPANPERVAEFLETMSMGEMMYQELLTCE